MDGLDRADSGKGLQEKDIQREALISGYVAIFADELSRNCGTKFNFRVGEIGKCERMSPDFRGLSADTHSMLGQGRNTAGLIKVAGMFGERTVIFETNFSWVTM